MGCYFGNAYSGNTLPKQRFSGDSLIVEWNSGERRRLEVKILELPVFQ